MINKLMEAMRGMETLMKMPFFYELVDVWKAMLLAYELLDENQIQYLNKSEYDCGEDGEWIIQLSEQIKKHWVDVHNYHEKHYDEVKKNINGKKDDVDKKHSIEELVEDAEKNNKQFMKKHPDISKTRGFTVFHK